MQGDTNAKNGSYTSGTNISPWFESVVQKKYESLKENLKTDVVIVGGGLAGLSVAYCLAAKGRKVVLVEDGYIGSGESGRTTAQLVTALDDRYYNFERLFGKNDTHLIADSHRSAVDFIEKTVKKENIGCDFERLDGYLFLHPSDEKDSLNKELEAASGAGLDVALLKNVPGMLIGEGSCICFKNQAQFHPLKYMNGLCDAIEKKGGKIYTETHASEISAAGIVTAKDYRIRANHVVIATNSPVNNRYGLHLKQQAYRTYVIAALIKKNSVERALWWDTGDKEINPTVPPYHYIRVSSYDEYHDLLISGGEDHPIADTHKESVPEEGRYRLLEEWTSERFKIGKIIYQWSGEVFEPMDSLAYIGHNVWDKKNVYIVTGDSGNGMTHCTIAGMLITDLISGKKNKWEHLYKPSRFTFKASGNFFKEFVGAIIAQFRRKEDLDVVRLTSIKEGEGRVIEYQKKKCGVYRDETGKLHIVSAECTHLQCSVKWNNDEKSWDCPCHGSRFTYEGKVINGPANTNLPAFSEKQVVKKYTQLFRLSRK